MTSDADLLAEGPPEPEFEPGIAERLPRKRVASAALIRDASDRILMLSPTYKPGWEIPGGVVDAEEEPWAACRREVEEELGLVLPVGRLLVVDWVPASGVWGDALHFVFDGGLIAPADVSGLVLQASEIASVRLAPLDQVARHVRPSMHRRLEQALVRTRDERTSYLRFGRPVTGP